MEIETWEIVIWCLVNFFGGGSIGYCLSIVFRLDIRKRIAMIIACTVFCMLNCFNLVVIIGFFKIILTSS